MKIALLTLMAMVSFGTNAAIHCKTSDDFKWNVQVSIGESEVDYRVSGKSFHSPTIKNSDGSYNLFDNVKGSEVFLRHLIVNGSEGKMFGTYVDLKKSEVIHKSVVPLTCVEIKQY
ncbi:MULTISPECIES: hypothetical protein [Vibrio]|nr:hypothetical protein [Vibrio chemaguriensis]MCA2416023.1 hypothetical protein [Vibrio chemaguriensis]MCA2427061.1 hypothetical protein [Vibrio chemaguriensis]